MKKKNNFAPNLNPNLPQGDKVFGGFSVWLLSRIIFRLPVGLQLLCRRPIKKIILFNLLPISGWPKSPSILGTTLYAIEWGFLFVSRHMDLCTSSVCASSVGLEPIRPHSLTDQLSSRLVLSKYSWQKLYHLPPHVWLFLALCHHFLQLFRNIQVCYIY